MPKVVSPMALASLQQETGNIPVVIVGINWGLGISYYSTKSFQVDAYNIKGCISEISSIAHQKRADNLGTCGEVTLEFDDSDGEFKFIADRTLIEKKPIAIWQHFMGNSSADYILLFYGKITGPVEWSEGQRFLRLSATSELESVELGYAPTREDFADLRTDVVGIPWPLVFGTGKHVPAVQIRKHSEALLASTIQLYSKVYKTIPNKGPNQGLATVLYKSVDECGTYSVNTDERNILYFESTDDINFPTEEPIELSIDGVIFEGEYFPDDNKFVISRSNIPMYKDVKLGARDSNDPDEKNRVSSSPDFDPLSGYNILWLDDSKINLNQKHCYFKTAAGQKDWYNFCEAQIGTKCYFKRPFRSPISGELFLMTAQQTIAEVYSIEKSGTENGTAEIIETLNEGVPAAAKATLKKLQQAGSGFWTRPSGTSVRLWNQDDPDIYVVSAIELEEITGVYAKRKVPLENGKEIEVFSPVPSYYYQIQLQSNYQIQGEFVSAILMYTPLQERDDGKWGDQIFVTCTSTVGPNTADIIKYLLLRFSDYGINSASFASVANDIDDTPSNFTIFERGDVLGMCQEIAWQARCALIVQEQIVSIRYLGEAGTPVMVLDESNIQHQSVRLGWSETVDLVTKLIATWTPDYQDSARASRRLDRRTAELTDIIRALTNDSRPTKTQTRYTIFENNIDEFGLIPREERIYIYDNEESVLKTLSFWGHRYSNVWRLVRLKAMAPAMLLQEFDFVTLDFPTSGIIAPINGMVEAITYDPNSVEVEMAIWLPSIAGTVTEASFAYGD